MSFLLVPCGSRTPAPLPPAESDGSNTQLIPSLLYWCSQMAFAGFIVDDGAHISPGLPPCQRVSTFLVIQTLLAEH
eukprot:scaffold476358_cov18-Prasinocladus_malaysianus.AAC.1